MAADSNSAERYIDHDELRNSLRSVLRFMPWVRHIFIVVSDGQRPAWLADSHHAITIVEHSSIFPSSMQRYLPTFNSFAIESFLDRIPKLSEHFLCDSTQSQATIP